MKKTNIGIIGVSGLVGRKVLEVLEEYGLLFNKVKFFASSKSIGKKVKFQNKEIEIEELKEGCFLTLDYALFCVNSDISKKWAIEAEKENCIVIDNSSAFRNDDDIPLIVSSINIADFNNSKRKIIANPNCSTIQSVIVLNEINKVNKINKIMYTTYQSISGAGKRAIDDYNNNTNEYFKLNIKNTCLPIIGNVLDNNYTSEEMKMILETKKILHNKQLIVNATCVRVPVLYCHGINVYVECEEVVDLEKIKKQLAISPQIVIMDDNQLDLYPSSIIALNNDLVYVGRMRIDINNPKAMLFYCVSDNLRIGAASNAIQILKYLLLKDQ